MPGNLLHVVERYLASSRSNDGESDCRLLERYAKGKDEHAFAVLLERHGRLVWGVCWRGLGHIQDAEDAFQATFLVLTRRAGTVRWSESVGNWLYGTATRVVAEVKARNIRQRTRDSRASEPLDQSIDATLAARELASVLDEELHHLPEKYRAPLLLCYLEGRTCDQAAVQLGWSLRTLERRLAEGRDRLRNRLTRRGLTLSGTLLAITLLESATQASFRPDSLTRLLSYVGSEVSPSVNFLATVASKGTNMMHFKLLAVACIGMIAGTSVLVSGSDSSPIETRIAASQVGTQNAPSADERGDPHQGSAKLAERVWGIIDVIERNHFDPPAKKDMILLTLKALSKAGGRTELNDLAGRAEKVTTQERMETQFRDLWPEGKNGNADDYQKLEEGVLAALFDGVLGKPQILAIPQIKISEQLRANRYVGIGVQLAMEGKTRTPQIVSPFRRGAARVAGSRPGDLILEVDGKKTTGASLDQVVEWLRGEEGTAVTIVVRQPSETESRTYKLVRAAIAIDSLYGFRRTSEEGWDHFVDRDSGIAYIWLNAVRSSTLQELRQVERRLLADGARAIVLDVRTAGMDLDLHNASLVTDGLLDGGRMWKVYGKSGQETEYRADREVLFRDLPMVVLMDESASNGLGLILAALQDNKRAVLVGEATTNEGWSRSLIPLSDGKFGITLYSGRLERPAKEKGWPVRPDQSVSLSKDQRVAVGKWLNDKHLPELPKNADDKPPVDPQFARGLEVLLEALKAGQPSK